MSLLLTVLFELKYILENQKDDEKEKAGLLVKEKDFLYVERSIARIKSELTDFENSKNENEAKIR